MTPEGDEGGAVAVALAARGVPLGAGQAEAHVADEGGQLDEHHQQSADGDAGGGGPHAPQGVQGHDRCR